MLILLNESYLQALDKITTSNHWITLVVMFLLFGIVLLKAINLSRLKGSIYSLFNINFIETESEEKTNFFDFFQMVFFIFSVIVISLLIFNFKIYTLPTSDASFYSFLSVFFSLFCYFLLLKIVEYLFIQVFLIKNEVRFFIISKSRYLNTISILLYVAIVLSQYTNLKHPYLYYFTGFMFLIRFVFHVVSNKNLIFKKLFYFILYICMFEIAPLFILFKLMF
ncbi:DUF4271 domain-containing protein [Polaribacter sp. Hel1_33_96]|uniref:DUF4271 domain-containing protein n=1 Tax=Polaribacter sp. Hel1_33_96 TaxID=1336805 RepID=UPI0026756E34|nr:DUF4271 domain-containing protein [Polaribacter sp. Hel1_33_96]